MSDAKPKSKKGLIIFLVAMVIIVSVALSGLYYYGFFTSTDGDIVVWKSGNSVHIKKGDASTSFSGYDANAVKITKGNRIFIKTVSSYNSSLFDIYYCGIRFNKISSPTLIDYAIKGTAFISDDGNTVYYLKTNEKYGVLDAVCHNTKTGKRTVFDTNVKEFYFFEKEDILYYTKMHSSERALYVLEDGEGKLVSKGIKSLNLYTSDEGSELVYTTGKGTLFTAYIIKGAGEPERIARNFTNMIIDGYKPGGNIYFFRRATSEMMWTNVIEDKYADSDSTMTKPNKKDYKSFFGYSNEYNIAYEEYQMKEIRDQIREGLNQAFEKGIITITNYDVSVYDGEQLYELDANINPDGLACADMEGEPLIIYQNIVTSEEKQDISDFADMAKTKSVYNIVNQALDYVNDSVRTEGYAVSFLTEVKEGKKFKTLKFEGLKLGKNSSCYYSNLLHGLIVTPNDVTTGKNKLTFYKFDEKNGFAKEAKVIGEDVSDFIVVGGGLVFMKGKDGDVYRYDESGEVKLSTGASSFFSDDLSNVYIMKNFKSENGGGTADFYVTSGEEEVLIADKCNIDSFSFDSSLACAIDSEKKLWLVSSGSRELISGNASEILAFG